MIRTLISAGLFAIYLATACAQKEQTKTLAPLRDTSLETKLENIQVKREGGHFSVRAEVIYKNTGEENIGPLSGSVSLCYSLRSDNSEGLCIGGGSVNVPELAPGSVSTLNHQLKISESASEVVACLEEGNKVPVLHLTFESIGYDVSYHLCN